ncbi:hypothetical protein [Microcoleus sp. F4-D5]|uniref:hypothetical protein n=1 Tax=Microcoleus sp. F4-D5 TaxID=2818760 RepID=UPI002FD0215F
MKFSREMRNIRAGYRSLYYRAQVTISHCLPSSIALKSWNQQIACDCPVSTPACRVNPTSQAEIINA